MEMVAVIGGAAEVGGAGAVLAMRRRRMRI